jgi:hypothetical protein
VNVGQAATFSVVAAGTPPLTYQWQKNGADITGATLASYTTPATATGDSGEMFRVVVSNSAGKVTSNSAALTVNPGTGNSSVDVITYHYDNGRTGQNLNETTLTPANVNSTQFGKKGEFIVDGKVDAQPLYLSQVTIGGQKKNVLYVATEHGSVYAFEADAINGTTSTSLWKVTTLGGGETTSDDRGCNQVSPEIGITAGHRSNAQRHLCGGHVEEFQRELFSAPARTGLVNRRRAFRRSSDHHCDVSGYR